MITPAKAIAALCTFFVAVLTVALANNRYYPVTVLAGENSVGTWLSGVLLVACSTLSLTTCMRRGWWPWLPLALFFMLLALDERFMFHEQLKERIILSLDHTLKTSRLLYELPVIVAACAGAGVAYRLWKVFTPTSRILLIGAVMFGSASVTIDVLAVGVVWEEGFKLIGELFMTCGLIVEVGEYMISD